MVLHRILEDLLQGASTARRVDDAAKGDGQDGVFTNTVHKILGDMGGKGSGRFMTIEPCGNAQTHILFLRIAVHHFECRRYPCVVLERHGSSGEGSDSLLSLFIRTSCHPCTQMGGLHRSRTSTAHHEEARLGEMLAQQCHTGKHGVGA